MTERKIDIKQKFIVRRAFRSADQTVVRADVVAAFGCSPTAASVLLTQSVGIHGDLLQRDGNKVVALPYAKAPHWADENDLMEALDNGRTGFADTGLRHAELPINISRWSSSLPSAPGAMTTIVEALTRKRSVYIRYVGMKRGDTARFRRVYPVVLERMGDQWRLAAHDLDSDTFALKVFVLSRITGAVADTAKLPRGFIAANPVDVEVAHAVTWDLRLNEDQKEALRNELGIDSKGIATLNSRDVHEFQIRFGGKTVSDDVIWPPLQNVSKKR